MTGLDAVDPERRGDQVLVLDVGRRSGVRGHADVLQLRRRREERHRVLYREPEVELRLLDGLAAELLDRRAEGLDVGLLVRLDRLELRVDLLAERVVVVAEELAATEVLLADVL